MKVFYSYIAIAILATLAVAETIQLESTQGILIPAPIAQRLARAAYGSFGPATFQAASSSASSGASASSGSSSSSSSAPGSSGISVPSYGGSVPSYGGSIPSYGGSVPSYGVPSIPSPPCPRNYLFSCAPNLTPVPCAPSAAAPSYGSASSSSGTSSSSYGLPAPIASSAYLQATPPQGAYSEFIPQYLFPGTY